MSTLTSVGGMAPLVFMPGSGSELYRGLGSVVVGGLVVSTFFTLILVPLLLSLLLDLQARLGWTRRDTLPEGGSRALGTPAALLLLAALSSVLPGCTGARANRPHTDLASRIAEQALNALPPAGQSVRLEPGESRVAAALADRLDELEQLGGGPSSFIASGLASPREGLDGRPAATRSLSLEAALDAALENNLGVRIARYRDDAAREQALCSGRRLRYDAVRRPHVRKGR